MSGALLTARQVAELLGLSAETVLRWTRRGELPALKLPGGAIRFQPDVLDEWLEERATPRRGSANHPAGRRPTRTLSGVDSALPTTPEDEED